MVEERMGNRIHDSDNRKEDYLGERKGQQEGTGE